MPKQRIGGINAPKSLNLIVVTPSTEGGWQEWLSEMTQEPGMYTMTLIAAWDVRYQLNNQHAHIVQCRFDDGGEETFHMHCEHWDDLYCASFQEALESACWYVKGEDN